MGIKRKFTLEEMLEGAPPAKKKKFVAPKKKRKDKKETKIWKELEKKLLKGTE